MKRRLAFSLVEALLGLIIVAAVLGPMLMLFGTTHRMGHSARRLVEVAGHGQALIEAIAELGPEELPALPAGAEAILLVDGASGAAGGGPQWAEIERYFGTRPPVDRLRRTIFGHRLPTGEVVVRIEIEWEAVAMDARTVQTLTLAMVASPRSWQ